MLKQSMLTYMTSVCLYFFEKLVFLLLVRRLGFAFLRILDIVGPFELMLLLQPWASPSGAKLEKSFTLEKTQRYEKVETK